MTLTGCFATKNQVTLRDISELARKYNLEYDWLVKFCPKGITYKELDAKLYKEFVVYNQ